METAITDSRKNAIKVLLVEDDDGDAKAIKRAFSKAKIANPIVRAIDGVEALELLRGNNAITKPFIMLIDLNMPRMDGISLIKEVRGDNKLKHAIIFVLTTSKKDEDKIAAYDLNVAGYILKERAGEDFLNITELLDAYWRIVEMPI